MMNQSIWRQLFTTLFFSSWEGINHFKLGVLGPVWELTSRSALAGEVYLGPRQYGLERLVDIMLLSSLQANTLMECVALIPSPTLYFLHVK